MTRLIITRHGETLWNLEKRVQGNMDSPLSEEGIKQARCLGLRLIEEGINVLYASDLPRAHHTALEIGRILGIRKIKPAAALREMNFGAWEGKEWSGLDHEFPELFALWQSEPHRVRVPGGEAMADVLSRAWIFLEDVLSRHPNETVCLVSHGITVKLLITRILGYGLDELDRSPWQHNTALNIIDIENHEFIPKLLGDCSHLDGVPAAEESTDSPERGSGSE